MEEKPKALMLASVASMIGQFNMHNIQLLLDSGFQVEVAANFKQGNTVSDQEVRALERRLLQMGVVVRHLPIPRKPSRAADIIKAYRQVKELCRKQRYRIIHCHSPIGGVVARAAAKDCRKTGTLVIYTAHGFHFYKGAPVRNWLLFYPAEWLCAWWTDRLVTINREDYRLARKHFHAKKVCYVPGTGIDRAKFSPGRIDAGQKRASLGVSARQIMLLSVGQLIPCKNHQAVIHAIKKLGNPDIRYFICGIGALEKELQSLVQRLGLEKQVTLLGYRRDIPQLCQAADLFVFPSKREGLPVALMEAIACKTPVMCSDIRGNRELVRDKSCMFGLADAEALAECLRGRLLNKTRQEFMESMQDAVEANYRQLEKYDLHYVMGKMEQIYKAI